MSCKRWQDFSQSAIILFQEDSCGVVDVATSVAGFDAGLVFSKPSQFSDSRCLFIWRWRSSSRTKRILQSRLDGPGHMQPAQQPQQPHHTDAHPVRRKRPGVYCVKHRI